MDKVWPGDVAIDQAERLTLDYHYLGLDVNVNPTGDHGVNY